MAPKRVHAAKADGIPLLIIFSGNRAGQTGRRIRRHLVRDAQFGGRDIVRQALTELRDSIALFRRFSVE